MFPTLAEMLEMLTRYPRSLSRKTFQCLSQLAFWREDGLPTEEVIDPNGNSWAICDIICAQGQIWDVFGSQSHSGKTQEPWRTNVED